MSEGDRNAPKGIGAVVSIPYGPVAEWLVESGYRWLVVDVEHAAMGPKEQLEVITAGHAAGATVYVRVVAIDERAIGFALDAGADGVIVPDVRAVDDAQRAAAACRYPPGGRRSIGPIRRQAPSPACIVQLESVDAITVADSIALVDGIDAVMVGPGDLALDAGLVPGVDTHHPTMPRLLRPGACRNRRDRHPIGHLRPHGRRRHLPGRRLGVGLPGGVPRPARLVLCRRLTVEHDRGRHTRLKPKGSHAVMTS